MLALVAANFGSKRRGGPCVSNRLQRLLNDNVVMYLGTGPDSIGVLEHWADMGGGARSSLLFK